MDGSKVKSDLMIAAVPGSVIPLVWDRVEPLIERVAALAPDDISPSYTRKRLESGNALLVTIARETDIIAVNVLEIRTLDAGTKVLYIPITAGSEMDLWLDDFLDVAKKIAKDMNCTELRGLAVRKGWMKKLEPYGWEEMFTTIRCKLGEE